MVDRFFVFLLVSFYRDAISILVSRKVVPGKQLSEEEGFWADPHKLLKIRRCNWSTFTGVLGYYYPSFKLYGLAVSVY